MRPLDGVFVLDFSTLLPGPMASLLLAEAGAEVVKIERPGRGDEMRSYEPRCGDDSVNFALLNRGKRSIALDLKDASQRDQLIPLIERADILIEQFRPGVMQRLGLGFEEVAGINPRLIYCSVTGYGQTGPSRDKAGHDLNYQAETGLLALSMGTPQHPAIPPALIADIAGGAYPAVINILLALRQRDVSGAGCHLDISMSDNLFPFMYWAIGNGVATGQWPKGGGELVTGGSARYRLYAASDGSMVAAAPLEQKFWEVFCDIIALDPIWRDDARDPQGTMAAVSATISQHDAEYWRTQFEGRDCCCSIVSDIREAMQDRHFRERGVFDMKLSTDDGFLLSALPTAIDQNFRGGPKEQSFPKLGQDNELYLGSASQSANRQGDRFR
jgi:alpha-methylacyl-CoA racemase